MTKKVKTLIILLVVIVLAFFGEKYLNKDIFITTDGGSVTVTDSTLVVDVDSTLVNFDDSTKVDVVPEKTGE